MDDGLWQGCESWGFASATSLMHFTSLEERQGWFNITTDDYLTSGCERSPLAQPDLSWTHSGSYSCSKRNGSGHAIVFTRQDFVSFTVRSNLGLFFAHVLCPHGNFSVGATTLISVDDLATQCSSVSFNNCAVFYDYEEQNDDNSVLQRAKAPSCDPAKAPHLADGVAAKLLKNGYPICYIE
eukprot:TRINITY_DN1187_c0_g1_i4.p1 TRINITY_DN1187_c0_g1~~TRINITY_DN1187_c0_g1_i4.p1  ORF type:complete len:182 (+),score=40.45 TRINITY_DN1187_c0_g1_i4:106-651(+)